jgi:hypothetical protein
MRIFPKQRNIERFFLEASSHDITQDSCQGHPRAVGFGGQS